MAIAEVELTYTAWNTPRPQPIQLAHTMLIALKYVASGTGVVGYAVQICLIRWENNATITRLFRWTTVYNYMGKHNTEQLIQFICVWSHVHTEEKHWTTA